MHTPLTGQLEVNDSQQLKVIEQPYGNAFKVLETQSNEQLSSHAKHPEETSTNVAVATEYEQIAADDSIPSKGNQRQHSSNSNPYSDDSDSESEINENATVEGLTSHAVSEYFEAYANQTLISTDDSEEESECENISDAEQNSKI